MKFWFRKHHYGTQFKAKLTVGYCTWFSHQDDCCDYWQPVDLDDPATKRAFMLDDELSLTTPKDIK